MKKTNDYDIFKFRADNRDHIDKNHVMRLVNSIQSKNLLELRPIAVNKDYEVIDGQHRLLAAKQLGVDIYYTVEEKLDCKDIVLMNLSKAWGWYDYLNYYCKNDYQHYLHLKNFIEQHKISLKLGMNITMGGTSEAYEKFRNGEYTFDEEGYGPNLQICWDTIREIRRVNGFSPYTGSVRFWNAMLQLIRHPDFDVKHWNDNYPKLIARFGIRSTIREYLKMMMDIYNYRKNTKISLLKGYSYD